LKSKFGPLAALALCAQGQAMIATRHGMSPAAAAAIPAAELCIIHAG